MDEPPLTFRTKLAYGLGNVAVMVAKQAPKRLCFPIYNIGLGVNAAWIGLLFSLTRLWDALTDPVIGHISDRFSSKYGRRKPFIAIGAVLTGLFFAMMWMIPRGLSSVGYITYLSIVVVLFYTALTIFSVPWYAMGYELTGDYDERTKLFAYPSFFSPIAQIGVAWLYFLTQRSFFDDTIEGARYVGAATGLLLIGFGLIPVFFVPRNSDNPVEIRKSKAKNQAGFLSNLKESLSCKPFLMISFTISGVLMASAVVGSLHYYINIFYIYHGDKAAASTTIGWYWTAVYGVAALIVPVIAKLGVRFGKKRVFQVSLIWGVVVMACRWYLFTPDMPYLQLLDGVMYAFLDASLFLFCQSMIADVCDYDELKFGHRREGVFAAIYGWLFKTGLALGALAAGVILAKIGFDKKVEAIPPEETLRMMRMIYSLVPGIVFFLTAVMFSFYPLTKEKMLEVTRQLKERNA